MTKRRSNNYGQDHGHHESCSVQIDPCLRCTCDREDAEDQRREAASAKRVRDAMRTANANETNPIPDNYHDEVSSKIDYSTRVPWTTPGLKVTRLRLLRDRLGLGGPMVLSVSYCHGELAGKPVKVALPFSDLPAKRWKSAVIEYAREDKVFAVGLGIFDYNVFSILY